MVIHNHKLSFFILMASFSHFTAHSIFFVSLLLLLLLLLLDASMTVVVMVWLPETTVPLLKLLLLPPETEDVLWKCVWFVVS